MQIKNLKEMLELIGGKYGQRAAFSIKTGEDSFKDISYEDFVGQVNALGTFLMTQGLGGKHIAVISENRYEWIVAYLAAICAGVVIPIDRDLPEESIHHLLEQGDAEAVFYSDVYEDIMANSGVKTKICFDNPEYADALAKGAEQAAGGNACFTGLGIDNDRLASMIFTSGTTGFSKGVMLSHRNITNNIHNATTFEKYGEHEVMLSILPYHHAFECTLGIMASLAFGCTVCINDSLKYIPENLQLFKPTVMFLVPAIVNAMYSKLTAIETAIERALTPFEVQELVFGGRLSAIFSGGAPLNVELITKFRDYGISLLQGYGLTETSPVVTATKFDRINDSNIASVGEVIPGCEVKIAPDGEIWIKGENVMLGYYKNPEATEAVITEDGWFKSGDLGYIDENGFVFINGRKKNLIIASGGENVYPEEIEQYLYNIKGELIEDALIYGGDDVQETGREVVTAVIVPKFERPETEEDAPLTREQVLEGIRDAVDEINEKLPVYKQIAKIKFRERPFEKTTSRKVKRNKENTRE
ncbi:MAG: AMP-dependent synthetase/ligase [Oscillospiraceae bacterium]|nr:AMP-dependent synthetase/ligase [Oscillospiraceae bacterium]